jgi:hypothetical protein
MTRRVASCSCGALTATCDGEPMRISVCHCLACQRRTGSSFGVQARFPVDRVTVAGEWREWTRTGDEGGCGRFRFCPVCGSIVWFTTDADPALVTIPVGAFAEPDFPAPEVSGYEERMHAWLAIDGAGIRHFD